MVSSMETVPGDGARAEPFRAVVGFGNQKLRATAPLIELVATPERLEFRARFGLGRAMGPWRLERAQVTKAFLVKGLMGDCIAVHGSDYLDWTIFTFSPKSLLLTLEELGYPVDWLYRT